MPTTPDDLKRDEQTVEQILLYSFRLFRRRNLKYKSAFKIGGVVDNAFQLRHKAIRMLQKCQDWEQYLRNPEAYVRGYGDAPEEPNLDDAYDLINYACFLIICIMERRWRPQVMRGEDGEPVCTCTLDRLCPIHREGSDEQA